MRKEHLRRLLEKVDIDKDAVFSEYRDREIVPDSLEGADKDFVFGCYYFMSVQYQCSLRYFHFAIEKYEKYNDFYGLFYALVSCAMNYRDLNNIEKAREMILTSYEMAIDNESRCETVYAMIFAMSLYLYNDNLEEAGQLKDKIKSMIQYVDIPRMRGNYYNNCGFYNMKIQHFDEAIEAFQQAAEIYENCYQEARTSNLILVWFNIGEMYYTIERYEEAKDLLEKVEKESIKRGMDDVLLDSLKLLHKLYALEGNYQLAVEKAKECMTLYESMVDRENVFPNPVNQGLKDSLKISLEELQIKTEQLAFRNFHLDELMKNNELIGNIGKKLTSAMAFDEIFEIIAEESKNLIDYNAFTLGLVDGENLVIPYLRSDNIVEKDSIRTAISLSDKRFVFSYCVKHNVDVKISHVSEYANYIQDKSRSGKVYNNSAIYVRLIYKNKIIGVMTYQVYPSNAYSDIQFSAMKSLAAFASIAIKNCQNRSILAEQMEELDSMSKRDPLTGLGNRRAFHACLQRYADEKINFYLLFADMNHLKLINDVEGHIVGDRYLLAVANVLLESAGKHDLFRISGDEFGIVMRDVSAEEVEHMINRISVLCETKKVGKYPLSLSIGSARSEQSRSLEDVFAEAEARMYRSKRDYYSAYADNI